MIALKPRNKPAAPLAPLARLVRLSSAPRSALPAGLTRMEMDALFWIAAGKRYADVALIMEIQQNALRQMSFRIRLKLGANTMPGAVAIALRRGIII